MTIFIPTPLRPYAGGKDKIEVNASTIAEALDVLTQTHPDLRKHLFSAEGKVRAFVNLYVNDEDVRYLPQKEQTQVAASDTLSIIPSIAGGAGAAGVLRERAIPRRVFEHGATGSVRMTVPPIRWRPGPASGSTAP